MVIARCCWIHAPVWKTLSECTAKLVLRRSPVIMTVLWIPLSSWDWIYD